MKTFLISDRKSIPVITDFLPTKATNQKKVNATQPKIKKHTKL